MVKRDGYLRMDSWQPLKKTMLVSRWIGLGPCTPRGLPWHQMVMTFCACGYITNRALDPNGAGWP